MQIGRGMVYRRMKELPDTERHEFLVSLGFTPDQAEDFITDYVKNTRMLERKPKDNTAFERMMEKMRARCEGNNGTHRETTES